MLARRAGYAAAVVLLWLFLRNVPVSTLADGLRSAAWPVLAAAVVVRLASLVVASLRWQALLAPACRVRLGPVLAITMVGMAATAVAPMQAAEVVRPYLLSKHENISFGTVLGTAMAEWLLDAVAVLALFVSALLWIGAGVADASPLAWIPIASVLCFALVLGALAGLARVPRWIAGRDRIGGWWTSFAAGLRSLEHRGGVAAVAGYSLTLAALTAVSAWLALASAGLPVSFSAGFLVLGLVTVAGMIPTPGAIGGFHAICQLGLVTFFHVDRAETVLPVLIVHAVLYLPGALIGALCLLWWPSVRRGRTR